MDLQALTDAVVAAINQANRSQIQALGVNRTMAESNINQQNSASGLLYSTRPQFQRTQYLADEFLPSYAQTRQRSADQTVSTRTNLQQTLDKIRSLNEAASELDNISFD